MSPGRRAAIDALLAVEKGRVRRLVDALQVRGMNRKEAGLARELATGTERNRGWLDFVVGGVAHRDLPRDPLVRSAIRLGAYQLLFLSRVPAHAAVHESVALAPRLKPLVNALLRGISRQVENRAPDPDVPHREIPLEGNRTLVLADNGLPDPREDWIGYMAQRHSLPPFLVSRWAEHLGRTRAGAVCAACSSRPALHLRVNRAKGTREELQELLAAEGVESSPADHPLMLRWDGGVPPFGTRPFAEGWFVIQDPTALRAAEAVGAEPGETVIDLCAAPGTKATFLAQAVTASGSVHAYDAAPNRRQRIRENVERLGLQGVLEVVEDPGKLVPAIKVLVDVPCSNTGVLARRVEVRRRLDPGLFRDLASVQGQLVRGAMDLVLPGGRLVYSTCSLEPEENEEVVRNALREGWELLQEKLTLPEPPIADGGYFAVLCRS